MNFASDNTAPVHPRVFEALARANAGHVPSYGADPLTAQVRDRVREIFEAPKAEVYLVTTGGAANALALAALARPWSAIFCTEMAHVQEDECNGPEFYTGGAKLVPIPAPDAKLTPESLRSAVLREETRGVHGPQRGPATITQATEKGNLYDVEEIAALGAVAKEFGLKLHMDGARIANALAASNASPADMTWRAGVDALSLGGTKNGLMGVEAVVLFDPAPSWELELRRKRGAHLLSKHRYLAAQMLAYLEGGLWLDLAAHANAACARLTEGLRAGGAEILWEPRANLLFARLPRRRHRVLQEAGAAYYLWDGGLDGDPEERLIGRFVCDWSTTDAEVDRLLALSGA